MHYSNSVHRLTLILDRGNDAKIDISVDDCHHALCLSLSLGLVSSMVDASIAHRYRYGAASKA